MAAEAAQGGILQPSLHGSCQHSMALYVNKQPSWDGFMYLYQAHVAPATKEEPCTFGLCQIIPSIFHPIAGKLNPKGFGPGSGAV